MTIRLGVNCARHILELAEVVAVNTTGISSNPLSTTGRSNAMRRIVFSAAFLLILVSSYGETAAQQSSACPLKLSQAPAVRGVKLDMNVDEFLSLFPGSSEHEFIKTHLVMADAYPQFG